MATDSAQQNRSVSAYPDVDEAQQSTVIDLPRNVDGSGQKSIVPPSGEIVHEGIPQFKETEHLAELKGIVSEHAQNENDGNQTPENIASLAQFALGKYSTAVSEETGIPPSSIQGMVRSSDNVDKELLKDELEKETRQRSEFETEQIDKVPNAGVASKVSEAAQKLDQIIKIDKVDQPQDEASVDQSDTQVPSTAAVSELGQQSVAAATTEIFRNEIFHEGIPQSKELEHLSELKGIFSELSSQVPHNHGIPKGSDVSLAQSAFGKYGTVISEEIGMPPLTVQGMMIPAELPIDEKKLLQELKEEAQQRIEYEKQVFGRVPRNGPGRKVEKAAEKLEELIKVTEEHASQQITNSQERRQLGAQ